MISSSKDRNEIESRSLGERTRIFHRVSEVDQDTEFDRLLIARNTKQCSTFQLRFLDLEQHLSIKNLHLIRTSMSDIADFNVHDQLTSRVER